MKIAIMESITTPGGHEVDFDRILVEELTTLGHHVKFYVPNNFVFKYNYGVPTEYLPGEGVSYTGVRGIKKLLYSAKREFNRQRWFKTLYKHAHNGEFDALIIPTSTYRYLRALNHNNLKKSPVPIIFIMHGINPTEAPKFFREVEKLKQYPQIRAAVLTFGSDIFGSKNSNVTCMFPPAYTARDIQFQPSVNNSEVLKLGFFGQYRREKKLDAFLDVFLSCKFSRPVELMVQGATMHPDDAEDFERIIAKYKGDPRLTFLHKGLIGREWQEAIAGIDALIMPYSAKRYLYHWAGMLFTAIGFQKPVVVSSEINPEVIGNYHIGSSFKSGNTESLRDTIQEFVNSFSERYTIYSSELERASQDFSPNSFAKRLVLLCSQ